ncbi:DUF177 domain-containing protein [Candidatus Sumerlaeota bacterium]|nr:DUF177 domain-containing protein [Candidatus Sumerlaeota bacterium]
MRITTMSLIVHIQDLKEHPVTLEINHPPGFFELEDKEFTFKDRVVGNVTFTLVQRNILASGWLETKAYTSCVRCLEEILVPLHAEVSLTYSNDTRWLEHSVEIDPMAEIVNYFDGEIIEPKNEFRELIMLELPFLPLCKPDCKGLCPQCGANLNKEQCHCLQTQQQKKASFTPEWKEVLRHIRAGH